MARSLFSSIETLESRIAPAGLVVYHPLLDLVAGMGKTSTTIDLGAMVDSSVLAGYRSHVEFTTNFDTDPIKPGIQPGKIILELFDDKAPLTVQNFINYINDANAHGDYDGVYFHRLVAGFVLQTGGYEASKLGQHIITDPAVHNEFDPTDAERSNKAGTIAMAKVGGDPNSATSEFFFNLADNSSNLDNQNGGFTVFGKVVSGMDVVNAIASLPTVSINGAGVPVHNGYNPDPDGNPNTSAPVPTAKQVVQITKAQVITTHDSKVPNTVYKVLGITDAATGNATDLVTGKIVGDNLTLKYKPNSSGIAKVQVQVMDKVTGDSVVEEFEVKVLPNLVASNAGDTLPGSLVVGDSGTATVKLQNTGGGIANGLVDVKYYLSHIDGTDSSGNPLGSDPTGTIVDANDILVGSLSGALINIPAGKSGSLTANVAIPTGTSLTDGSYRLIAKVTQPDGSTITELFSDDNVTLDGSVHNFYSGPAKANLTTLGVSDTLPGLIVPGDTGKVKVNFGNNSGFTASGQVVVNFYLSLDSNPANSTDGLDSNDILIGQVSQSLVLAPGKTMSLESAVTIPPTLNITEGYYHILALVSSPSSSGNIAELTTGDNLGGGNYHALQLNFGTFALSTIFGTLGRKDAVLTYLDTNSNPISMKMTGAGYGAIVPTSSGGIEVQIDGTNLKSKFAVSTLR